MANVQLATLWNSTTPAAPAGRMNIFPQTDGLTPVADSSWNIYNHGKVSARTTTTETIAQADLGKLITFNNASAIAVTINTPTDANFMCYVLNRGVGQATFTPSSGTINGGANVILTTGQDGVLFWDGTNWEIALGGGPGTGVLLQTNGTNNGSQTQLNLAAGTGISVTDNGSGTVTIAAGGAGPSPISRRWAYASSGGIALGNTGSCVGDLFTGVALGAFNAPNSTTPWPYTKMTSSTSGSSSGSHGSNSWRGGNILYQTKILFETIATIRFRAGLGDTSTEAIWIASDSLTTSHYAAFRFSTNVPDTHFQCETGDGTTVTTTDSGITVAANTTYTLQIKFNDSTPNVVFSINGTVVATNTTHLPGATTVLTHYWAMVPLANVATSVDLGWIYIEGDN